MEKEFVPYDRALRLKGLGFDEPCFGYGDNNSSYIDDSSAIEIRMFNQFNRTIKMPTFSQAFRWFREKYKIGAWIHHYYDMDKGNFTYSWVITLPYKDDGYVYDTYQEAELACLDRLIDIITNKRIFDFVTEL